MSHNPAKAPANATAPGEPPKPDESPTSISPTRLRHIAGSNHDDFNLQLTNAVLGTAWAPGAAKPEARATLIRAITAGMQAFKPVDEIEGMIAAQAVALHHASMEWSRRAMIPDQGFEPAREYRKAAANSSRAFVELLAALDRKRGKGGQQKVTVEHVHVHSGGQAIVGNVAPAAAIGGGGGDRKESAGEPHAPPARLAHDATAGPVFPPLRGTDAEREAVPVARDA